jgi:2,4-dienoyl-CoA reductase-like NADH-dependent reductase (Old Yellow Enzyme family)
VTGPPAGDRSGPVQTGHDAGSADGPPAGDRSRPDQRAGRPDWDDVESVPPPATLLTPLALGPAVLPNRVVSTAHQTGLVHDHLPTGDLIAYHAARACGGVGAVFLEATAVDPSGLLTSHTLAGFLPGIVPCYRLLAAAVHAQGTRCFVQLFHGGREQISSAPRAPAVAPSAVPSPRFRTEPRALSAAEIRELVAGYATAARLAREGGVDGVEITMAHGYLFAQFFAARTNRRDDAYAAPLAFAVGVLHAVREATGPDFAVGVRLAADECVPDGLDGSACAEIARELCATGLVDFASFALGHSATYVGSNWIVPPPPAAQNAIAAALAPVRAAIDVPVIATTRVVDLGDAEALVASGAADAVGMTRALIADPDLVAKARREEQVIACIGCNQACIGHYHAGVPIGCVVNPRTGRERTLPAAVADTRRARVLVIGGGPAGVSAALEAAAHGDAVTLLERTEALGGQFALAGRAPAHREAWPRWLASARRRLTRAAVEVRLRTEATAADADGFDVVVLAAGARPFVPDTAEPAATTIDAWAAVAAPEDVAGPVLVADWGGAWEGLDAAEVLAEAGHEVTLASASPCPGDALHQYQRNLYLARLDERGVAILHHLEVAHEGGRLVLRHVFSGRTRPLPPAETLVRAAGRVPDDGLWPELEGRPGCVRAGDVLGPRSLEEAILEGVTAFRAARAEVTVAALV